MKIKIPREVVPDVVAALGESLRRAREEAAKLRATLTCRSDREDRLLELLEKHAGEPGMSEGLVETLERIIEERDTLAARGSRA